MRALVTGGGGFLGGAIVRKLLERNLTVRTFSRNEYPELAALGVEQELGDLADAEAVDCAVTDCELVFHVAAKAGVWGPEEEYHKANVLGTQNVVKACRRYGVPRLVYTSTPSVVHSGGDVENADESLPYAKHFATHYQRTKAAAEKLALEANGRSMATVALRPHLIWGPGDNHILPRFVARANAGKLRIIGDGLKKVDATYIDNAAQAHLDAADRLAPGAPCAGKAYFIANGEPMPIWSLLNGILDAAGAKQVTKRIPFWVAYSAAATMEGVHSLFRLKGEPLLTRFVAKQLSTAHWFDLSAAKRDLGYEPQVSTEQGLARLREWFRDNPE